MKTGKILFLPFKKLSMHLRGVWRLGWRVLGNRKEIFIIVFWQRRYPSRSTCTVYNLNMKK